MENFDSYSVIVDFEIVDGVEYPVIEEQVLEAVDVALNYEWADEEMTILRLIEPALWI